MKVEKKRRAHKNLFEEYKRDSNPGCRKTLTKCRRFACGVAAPLLMVYKNEEYYISRLGQLSRDCRDAYLVSRNELKETMEYMSNYSLYAFEEEMKQGFLTIQGDTVSAWQEKRFWMSRELRR